jgi:hypothetical protein
MPPPGSRVYRAHHGPIFELTKSRRAEAALGRIIKTAVFDVASMQVHDAGIGGKGAAWGA